MTFEEWSNIHHREWYLRGDRFEMLEKAWNASAEAHKPRWIPVSERLPDKEEIYPVLLEGCNWWFTRRYENNKWELNEDEIITHWLDLPELPE